MRVRSGMCFKNRILALRLCGILPLRMIHISPSYIRTYRKEVQIKLIFLLTEHCNSLSFRDTLLGLSIKIVFVVIHEGNTFYN